MAGMSLYTIVQRSHNHSQRARLLLLKVLLTSALLLAAPVAAFTGARRGKDIRPATLVLVSGLHRDPELLRSMNGPVRVPDQLARKEDSVRLAVLQVRLRLLWLSDEAHSADRDVRVCLLQRLGERDLSKQL